MKHFLLFIFVTSFSTLRAQKIDSIYVNLYTDSLKKGTYNYINIDGLLSNGSYLPLDSSHLIFTASGGMFSGNSLWIDPDFKGDKVTVKVILKNNTLLSKQFDIYIKKKPDNEKLRTADEIMNDMRNDRKGNKKRNFSGYI